MQEFSVYNKQTRATCIINAQQLYRVVSSELAKAAILNDGIECKNYIIVPITEIKKDDNRDNNADTDAG